MESRRRAEREWSTGAAPMINDVPNENSVKFMHIEATRSKKRLSGVPVINFEQNDDGVIQYLASLAPVSCRSFPAIKKRRSMLVSESGLNTLWEVREMTDNYAKKIGESGSGTVYYGKLQTGQEVAVKVWAQRSRHQAAREFSWFQMCRRHLGKGCEYFVQMMGYCEEGDQRISIYGVHAWWNFASTSSRERPVGLGNSCI